MHQELWKKLNGLTAADIALRTQCHRLESSHQLEVKLINQVYWVDLVTHEILNHSPASGRSSAGFLEQLCILSYFIHAKNIPLAGHLVKAEQLEAGEFFFRGPHVLPVHKLAQAFGQQPAELLAAGRLLGGKPCGYGDASVEIQLFERVPATFIVWGDDEEFAARASILFDETAGQQLPLDALGAAVNLAVNAMTY